MIVTFAMSSGLILPKLAIDHVGKKSTEGKPK